MKRGQGEVEEYLFTSTMIGARDLAKKKKSVCQLYGSASIIPSEHFARSINIFALPRQRPKLAKR